MFEDLSKNNIFDELKVDVSDYNPSINMQRKEFADRLTDNPELLDYLSINQLETILKYYENEVEKNRQVLKKLNA